MKVKAWKNGSFQSDNVSYGLKIDIPDRDNYFHREWKTILLELEGETVPAEVNIDKDSFWDGTCRELISVQIGRWLLKNQLAPWPKGNPPVLTLAQVDSRKFRLTCI